MAAPGNTLDRIEARSLSPAIGVEVTGIDLRQPLDEATG